MALSTVFRRASSTVATLAFRAARSPVTFRSGAVSAERLILGSQLRRGSISSFSTESAFTKKPEDHNLTSVIESEIECALEEEAVLEDKPEGFPFEIVDTPGERTLLLKRKFEDENIQLQLNLGYSYNVFDEEDEEVWALFGIPMVVSVAKGEGTCLEFRVIINPRKLWIKSLTLEKTEGSDNESLYKGPHITHWSSDLRMAFHSYLEIRGIKPSFTKSLTDYLASKHSKECVQWLNGLKSFVHK